jgi:RhtB (resistance to homoserine/threonine) family protein
MDSSTIAFAGVAALLVITPGADMALVAKNGLAHGRRTALATALGVTCGGMVWTCAAAFGVAAFVRSSQVAFNTLRIAGAVYLFYLGLQAIWLSLRRGRSQTQESIRVGNGSSVKAFRQGIVSNLLNPKLAVFFTSLLPQFVSPGQPVFARSLELGAIMLSMAIVWLSFYACLVARTGMVLRRSSVKRWLDRLTGTVLVAFGLRLATERR